MASALGRIVAGAVAGAVGTAVMDLVWYGRDEPVPATALPIAQPDEAASREGAVVTVRTTDVRSRRRGP